MALTLTLVVPAVVAVWLLAAGRRYAPRTARGLALIASVVTFLLTLVTVVLRTEVDAPWVTSLGLRWHFAVDGVTIPLVLLTAALGVAVVVHARGREPGRPGGAVGPSGGNSAATYYACLLLVEFGALATFFARDAILFFVAFEVVLVPMWVLISRFGDDHATERARADASNRFVLFTALGSTLMLLGILVLVVQSGHLRPRPARRRARRRAVRPDPGGRRGPARRRPRHQGAALAAAHLAARRPTPSPRPPGRCCWPPCC